MIRHQVVTKGGGGSGGEGGFTVSPAGGTQLALSQVKGSPQLGTRGIVWLVGLIGAH